MHVHLPDGSPWAALGLVLGVIVAPVIILGVLFSLALR